MDRGIATAENIKMLKAKGFGYVLITRGPRNSDYLEQFENYENDPLFESVERNGYAVHLKKIVREDGMTEVLCVSDKKRVKDPESPDSALDLLYERLSIFDIEGETIDPLSGTYVIESTHADKSAEEIWTMYMTLTKVEKAFRSMKSDLGTRPIYHQKAIRTEAHLFISVLAFHLLCPIERTLRLKGIKREWQSVREDLDTHHRSTIILQDEKSGGTHHVRVSGMPKALHEVIYRALGIKSKALRRKFFIARL